MVRQLERLTDTKRVRYTESMKCCANNSDPLTCRLITSHEFSFSGERRDQSKLNRVKPLILVTCALPGELALFTRRLRLRRYVVPGRKFLLEGVLGEGEAARDVMVLYTGVGAGVAANALSKVLLQAAPHLVLISGTAGAFTERVNVGDIIIACNHGEESLQGHLMGIALNGADSGISVWQKPLHTAEQVVSGVELKKSVARETGAFAVDMESAALARIVKERGLAHAVVRVISDGLSDNIPLQYEIFINEDGFLSRPRLAGYLLSHPWKIPGLIAFTRQTHGACLGLAEVLEKMILAKV